MRISRRHALALPLFFTPVLARSATPPMIVGSYEPARMRSIKGLTFPRLHLYSGSGKLIERDAWPRELSAIKQVAGDAFCCVSDKPSPPGWLGPPPDCKVVVYGENVGEHFIGLRDSRDVPLTYEALPRHRYLIVEYYAAWCAPCIPARRALESFLSTPASQEYAALVVDFTKLAPGK
jgi:hypothetical protein